MNFEAKINLTSFTCKKKFRENTCSNTLGIKQTHLRGKHVIDHRPIYHPNIYFPKRRVRHSGLVTRLCILGDFVKITFSQLSNEKQNFRLLKKSFIKLDDNTKVSVKAKGLRLN